MKIIFDALTGRSVGDYNATQYVTDIYKEDPNRTITVSTSNVIDEARVQYKQGKIARSDLTFEFKGKEITIDKYGKLSHWPEGFCDCMNKRLSILLGFDAR